MDWKLMDPHYTHLGLPVNILLENSANELETSLAILQSDVGHSKNPTFGEYVKSVLDELGLSPYAVEQRSKEEARRRGLDVKAFTISDAKIADIIAGVPSNHTMNKLCGLAWAIDRPIEEVVAHAFGFANRRADFERSEAFKLWESQQRLSGEMAKYYAQRIADLKTEIDQKVRAARKQGR
jgi:hypothetical protein